MLRMPNYLGYLWHLPPIFFAEKWSIHRANKFHIDYFYFFLFNLNVFFMLQYEILRETGYLKAFLFELRHL